MLTETISLIAVVVMAWLLWREHRKRQDLEATVIGLSCKYNGAVEDLNALQAEHLRWSDRDEKGRFVKRERGEAA